MRQRRLFAPAAAGLALLLLQGLIAQAAQPEKKAKKAAAPNGEFARTTIDLGVVVSDVKKSVEFYTKAIGFKQQPGFSVPGDFAKKSGLTDNRPLKISVLTLGDDETATRLKLMQVPGSPSKKSDNEYIDSQLGFSYLTIFVKDANKALARLKKAGVKPVAEGPVPLPKNLPQGVFLTIVRDPDGNLIELVGPKGKK